MCNECTKEHRYDWACEVEKLTDLGIGVNIPVALSGEGFTSGAVASCCVALRFITKQLSPIVRMSYSVEKASFVVPSVPGPNRPRRHQLAGRYGTVAKLI